MTPERWRQIKRVFAAALETEPLARAATVDELCEDDDELRDEVRSLLAAHDAVSRTGSPALGLAPAARTLPDPEFAGDARFEVQARLGAGGFGVVYRAVDRARGRSVVALKVLRQPDGLGLVRFKREFRALADLTHPHLVRLDELFAESPRVFFTMELVNGRAIVEALRRPRAAADWVAVGRAFAGVVDGVRALHQQGLIHRDLKPSNVLLTAEGRAVILDFGLAASLRAPDGEPGAAPAGTPAYMAPEQFQPGGSSPASDWYAVGVMLYELLAGRPPFAARFDQLIGLVDAKTRGAAPLSPESARDVPEPLVRLCEAWLAPDPGARPGSEEALAILRALGGEASRPEVVAPKVEHAGSAPSHVPAGAFAVPFVGRAAQLAALRSAWTRSRAGELAVVCLRGASGMGKTLLVRRFLDELRSPDAIVLEGCCHEREALPFKALDGVVDGIGQLLESAARTDAAELRPDGFEDLEQLFPVLRSKRHRAPTDTPMTVRDDGDRRRRAFSALRELLRRLAARRPVALFIDDLQWGDDDSAALLRALLRPERAPALMLVAACRQDVEEAPAFAGLLDALSSSARYQEISVEPLEADETRALAAAWLGEGHPEIDAVVAEAGGVPFFVDTLVQEMREHTPTAGRPEAETQRPAREDGAGARDLRLQTVIGGRVQRLPAPARRLLEAVAFAGKPLSRPVLEAAADIGESDGRDIERLLRARRFVRLSGDGASLEAFHDRVRDGVAAAVDGVERVQIHGRLARALAASGTADPEDLAHHLAAAGEREAAAEQAVRAADRRAETLAFDRAAALYAMAIELRGPEHADTGRLATKRAEALAAAGHGGAAAAAYFAAADRLPAKRAALTCRGAEQLLRAGEIDEGRRVMERVLRRFRWRVPRTAVGALLATVARRAIMAVRGLRLPSGAWSAGPRSPASLLLMDASWALASSAMMLDAVRSSYYQTHHLRLALGEREPFRLARALGLEAISASLPGARSPARADRMLELQRTVATSAVHPIMAGLAPLAEGVVAANRGDWRRARDRTLLASELLAAHGSGVAWELSTARSFLLGALASLGRFREYAERFPPFLEDARTRGDLYAEAVLLLSAGSYIIALKDDRVADAEAEVDRALAQLGSRGFHLPKIWALFAKVDIALYARDPEKAWHLLAQATPVMRSLLFYVQTMRVYMRHQRGRVALALATNVATAGATTSSRERTRRRFLAVAAREAVSLERERLPWGAALALTLRAGLAHGRGDPDDACALLAEADRALGAVDMSIHAAGARLAFGRLRGGADGAAAIADAEAWMRSQDVRYPERVSALVCPGLP